MDPRFSSIDYAAELNPQQLAAVQAEPGPALILAGAGSGKTRTLTYRVSWLLDQGVKPWEILLLTFTNKAAREMLGRVEELTGVDGRKFWGGTFHSIGQRLLRRDGEVLELNPSFSIMDEGEAENLLKRTIEAVEPGFLRDKSNPKARVIHDIISYARNTRRTVKEVAAERLGPFNKSLPETLQGFFEHYQKRKRLRQVCDYDDLLEMWLRLLQEHESVAARQRARYKYVLVDEFQDTNRLQFEIIRELAREHRNLTIVGDNWQCIYTWRGAEFSNMADFSREFPERTIYKIETNYRSTPEILEYANSLMVHHPPIDGYPLELQAAQENGAVPMLLSTIDTTLQATTVIERIRSMIEDEGRSPSDIAVLYRAHYHAMDLQMELSRRQIAYTITSGVRFFEQAHVRDLSAHLRLVANPSDSPAWERLIGLLPKVGSKTAEKLFEHARTHAQQTQRNFLEALQDEEVAKKVPKAAQSEWDSLAQTLGDLWRAQDEGKSPGELVRMANEGWYSDHLRTSYADWQRRAEDLESLVSFAERHEDLTELLAQLVLLSSESGDRGPDNIKGIRLTTIHQAKGLEFPVVFVIGLADGLFPTQRAIDRDDLDEERRLFYVAITRAQEQLYLVYPMITSMGGQPRRNYPSRFVQDIPDNRFEVVRVRNR